MEPVRKIPAPLVGASSFYHWEEQVFVKVTHSPFEIGRKQGDFLFGKDRMISRLHCRIEFKVNSVEATLTDLGSQNGTFLNGVRLKPEQPYVLREGDWVRIGQQHLFYTRRQIIPDVSRTFEIPGSLRQTTASGKSVSRSATVVKLDDSDARRARRTRMQPTTAPVRGTGRPGEFRYAEAGPPASADATLVPAARAPRPRKPAGARPKAKVSARGKAKPKPKKPKAKPKPRARAGSKGTRARR